VEQDLDCGYDRRERGGHQAKTSRSRSRQIGVVLVVLAGLPPAAAPASRSRTEADRQGRVVLQGGAGVPPSYPPTLAYRAGVGWGVPATRGV